MQVTTTDIEEKADDFMKYYVLDTNVLLHSPNALFLFNEHFVILPEVVLEELDRFKAEASERGANSRQVIRSMMNANAHLWRQKLPSGYEKNKLIDIPNICIRCQGG